MSASLPPITLPTPEGDGYVPGVCNIGPWEIRRRRTFAIIGFAAAIVLLVALVAAGAPPIARFLVLLPAWGGTFSWLQARRRFCAGFAMAGISNFADGEAGRQAVTDPAAHRADVQATLRMTRDSFLIAFPVTIVAVLLPV
ncbi:MAG TPA: hypothetical protein VIK13_10860 [Candidatus Limnocylindrales bacterium]